MTAIQEISNIFSWLHDGTITGWSGNRDSLILVVECTYLAERIDPSFDLFYVELHQIDLIEFDPWTIPVDQPAVIKTDFFDIFKAELEILSTEIKEDTVVIICDQHDKKNFDYRGGNLSIRCEGLKLFDQNKNLLTPEQFEKICSAYWDEWSQQ